MVIIITISYESINFDQSMQTRDFNKFQYDSANLWKYRCIVIYILRSPVKDAAIEAKTTKAIKVGRTLGCRVSNLTARETTSTLNHKNKYYIFFNELHQEITSPIFYL